MNHASAIVILALLLFGPLAVAKIEHNIELYCLALGVPATLLGGGFTRELILEVHGMTPPRARGAILSLLISGWMLIPGNIPNIVSAGALRIGSAAWAKIGVPMGLIMLGIYFAVFKFLG